jgi:hypothetical protein
MVFGDLPLNLEAFYPIEGHVLPDHADLSDKLCST